VTTARHFIKSALGNRKFDVVHAHQPQVADLSDLFQCHFLTRAALSRKSLTGVVDARSALVRIQEQGVLYVEDRFYRSWNPGTKMLYGSDLTRDDFHNLHGKLPLEGVLVHAFPTIHFPTDAERKAARTQYVGDYKGPVLGFLGGLHERKGYRRLVEGLKGDSDVMLLMGGQFSDGYTAPGLEGRLKAVGLVHELKPFYDACDAVIVPSYYEPLGLVAFEAAARGLPVIATEEVGALPHLVEYGAGAEWKPGENLTQVVKGLIARREQCNAAAVRMQQDLGMESYTHRLLDEYELIRGRGQRVEGTSIVN
jgi:glycosyltransferase involved in cell wall biosynthesis